MKKFKCFIVHGHDDVKRLELKNYLQNTIGLMEPIILSEKASLGYTIIEKFEKYAGLANVVFVLLTPDDVVVEPSDPEAKKMRARQNVIFELGYFLGKIGRKNGRVILLHSGPLELPTDIAGIVYIDISKGVPEAGEIIRRELEAI